MIIDSNNQTEFRDEITYQSDIGLIFKKTLTITPKGITWEGNHYPLEAITRVRWGGVESSVNGIPMGTQYTIAFGDNQSEAVISLRRKKIYSTVVDKLWQKVCVRLIRDLAKSLAFGKAMEFGNAVHRVLLKNDGITLAHKSRNGIELTNCLWNQISTWNSNGSFYIAMRNDKNNHVRLSYIGASNIHILEKLIQMALNTPGIKFLSDLFK